MMLEPVVKYITRIRYSHMKLLTQKHSQNIANKRLHKKKESTPKLENLVFLRRKN